MRAGTEVEWLHVTDYDIQYCRGCNNCLSAGPRAIEDDLGIIREKLLTAD